MNIKNKQIKNVTNFLLEQELFAIENTETKGDNHGK